MAYESDYDCPDCGGPMKLRTGRFGEFYGCRAYPDCTGTRDVNGFAKGERKPKPAPVSARPKPPVVHRANAAPAPDLEVEDTAHRVPQDVPTSAPSANENGVDLPEAGPVDGALIPPCTLQLDEHQQKIVDWCEGSALVAAGAGSGKSTVLVERTAALLTAGVIPEHIVTLVYNTSAAKDMKGKLVTRLGAEIAQRVDAFTFHGWAFRVLKRWNPGARQYQNDRIIGTPDGPNAYYLAGTVQKRLGLAGEADVYLRASELIREALIDLEDESAVAEIAKLRVSAGTTEIANRLYNFTIEYQREKARREAIDFADMLYFVGLEILRSTPRAMKLATMYQHVQVDEAQDINRARMTIARKLAEGAASFVCVGDLRQSIYGFTGARPDLFKGLLGEGAKLLTLPVNRRSTGAVVRAGNFIADGRDWNLGGDCSAVPGREDGEPLRLWSVSDTAQTEGAMVATEILARQPEVGLSSEGGKANYVVLVRTNAQAATFEAALMSRNLPVRVLGTSGGVWTTTPGREIRAYLAAAEGHPTEDVTRIANKPLRYLKAQDVKDALHNGQTFVEALRAIAQLRSNWRPERHGAWDFANDLELLAKASWSERCKAVSEFLISDLHRRAQEDAAADAAGQVVKPDDDKEATYKALAEAAMSLGSLDEIEGQIKKVKKDEQGPAVEISTMHKAKGMEWHTVFVAGVAEGLLPHEKSEDDEEERRLFYVAVTRAKSVCIVSTGMDKPSPFFEELRAKIAPPDPEPPSGGGEPLLVHDCTTGNVRIVKPIPAPLLSALPSQRALLAPDAQPPPTLVGKLAETYAAINEIRPLAVEQGEKEKSPLASGPGSRFVLITREDMEGLLTSIGFTSAPKTIAMRMNQHVYELGFPPRGKGYYTLVRVYSTIPLGDGVARDLGEDSIKVVALKVREDDNDNAQPLHRKLPYACRTRNWRTTLLDKIEEVLHIVEAREGLTTKES